jgi:hypothetical protein
MRERRSQQVARDVATRDRSTGCWLWDGPTDLKGYGRISYDGRSGRVLSHVVLEFDGRSRPEKPADLALHSCDTPPCYNPAHLRWGTSAENSAEMVERGRSASKAGELCGKAILTADRVREIRALAASGVRQRVVAERFGIGRSTVWHIVSRRRWKHVA